MSICTCIQFLQLYVRISFSFIQQLIKSMQDNSSLFNIDKSEETDINKVPFFNKNTEIIREDQRRKVVFGTFEQQKKSLYETLEPYLYTLALTTGNLATEAGKGAFSLLKNGLWWVYQKFTNNVIPYTAEQLPKLLFVISKNKKKPSMQESGSFCVLQLEDQEYQKISNNKQGKKRVIIPLGNQNDQNFRKFLQKQNFVQQCSFPIDIDDEEQMKKESFMIPSETFQILYDEAIIKNMESNIPIKPNRIIHKLPNCFVFDLQGKNSIQYDLLDGIEKNQKCQSGLFVLPENLARSNSAKSNQSSGQCPLQTVGQRIKQQKQEEQAQKIQIRKKIVDNTRAVKVQINQNNSMRQQKRQRQMMLE